MISYDNELNPCNLLLEDERDQCHTTHWRQSFTESPESPECGSTRGTRQSVEQFYLDHSSHYQVESAVMSHPEKTAGVDIFRYNYISLHFREL